jgi:hypothetical protein
MTKLKIQDMESAPEESKKLLEKSKKAYGSVPALHGVLAGSPQILEAYQKLHELFTESSYLQNHLLIMKS